MSKLQQISICLLIGWLFPLTAQGQVANVLTSVGAASRGAVTAMPLDASNSQFWNPAGITDLPETELDLNIAPTLPHIHLNSTLPADSLAPNTPPADFSGRVDNNQSFYLGSSIGFVKKIENSPWAAGIIAASTFGSGVHYRQSDNPITSPTPPEGFGRGDIKATGELFYVAPTIARRFGEHWSLGVQPIIAIFSLKASPFAAGEPDDANLDGIATFPKTNRAWSTGAGIQGGVYYHNKSIHLGASLKSPIWTSPLHFESKDELGQPRNFNIQLNDPMTLSMGVGYSGIPRTRLSMDVRYINYENTSGFSKSGFSQGGAVRGLGWRNIWAFVESAQFKINDKCALRFAYAYNQMPIKSQLTAFSITNPSTVQHQMSVAVKYYIRPNMALAVAYLHGFTNSKEGPIQRLQGPVPGSSVKITSSLNSVIAGLIFYFK